MASAGLQPQPELDPGAAGWFLTFIVPARNGCNLKCPFCVVRQRREIANADLRPEDFARFVREVAERKPVVAVAIQGYEPLLPESFPYTQAILAAGRFRGLRTSLVTNGVTLADATDLLATLSPNKIAISIDAADAAVHDRLRGLPGAWAAAVAGIERAIRALTPRTRLVVSSVLMPSRRHYLDAMPSFLRDIGIDRWIINPLLRVGTDQAGGPVGDRVMLFRDLLLLQQAADSAGISLTVDDEFNHLGHDAACMLQPALRAIHVRTLPSEIEIFRLTPSGQCSAGDDILRRVSPDTPRWRPKALHAGDFLDMLSKPTTASQQQGLALPHIT
jgi:pyruvate-formate lyase-activating enzyme